MELFQDVCFLISYFYSKNISFKWTDADMLTVANCSNCLT